jgi:predicted Zn-dependent protease
MRAFLPLLGLLALTVVVACATSPLGRRQLILVSGEQMVELGVTSFTQMKKDMPAAKDPKVVAYVNCVARNVTSVMPPNKWEVQVFEDKNVNAFALPGGKIGVYTGLLNVAKTQDQLAAVLGHEVSHVIAEHGNARMSAALATQAGLTAAEIYAASSGNDQAQILGLLGLGAQVGILLPYSRSQESEADLLGLDLMARAGFDPRQAVALWHNMAKAGGEQPPEFLSTHPSHENRIEDLKKRMASDLKRYRQARAQGNTPSCSS